MKIGLFPDCVLPGCGHPVSCIGEACEGCRTAFGDMLQLGSVALTATQIDKRDHTVQSAYARRGFA